MGPGKADREKEDRVWGLESGAIELGIGLSNRKYKFIAAGLIRESHLGNEHHRKIGLLGVTQMRGPKRGRVLQSRPQVMTYSIGTAGWRSGIEEAEPKNKCSCKQNHGITATRTNPGFTTFHTKRHTKERG